MPGVARAPFMPLSIETCVAQHIGDRAEQQDRVSLIGHPHRPDMLLAVLADGMGGHTGGGLAAEQLIIRARQNFEVYSPKTETPEQLLNEIVHDAHVVVTLSGFTSEKQPHTTAVVFLLQGNRAHWAHCGDSRLYHFRDGKPLTRTRDHSLVEELVRSGRIGRHEAEAHPQRHVLVSCLGSTQAPRVEHGGVDRVRAGDVFLLCSDGLWAHFDESELAGLVARQGARAAAEELVAAARERAKGGGDNISLAVVKLVQA